jgi:outer membrane protein assembly factor BamB
MMKSGRKKKEGGISSYPVIVNNQIIVGVVPGKIISLDIYTGKINWIVALEDEYATRIVYIENSDILYVCSNNLFEINIMKGEINKVFQIHEPLRKMELTSVPLFVSESFFYTTSTRRNPSLILLDKTDGSILEVHELDDYCYKGPTVQGNYMILVDASDNLYFFKSNPEVVG